MKTTKTQMVDFIYNNFTRGGKKIPKKILNDYSTENLEEIIVKNNCQDELAAWINRHKMIKFMVDGIQNGKDYSWDCEYPNEEECKRAFENDGIKVIRIATKNNHHRCKYCGGITQGKITDLLCDECREVFGHTYYSEL